MTSKGLALFEVTYSVLRGRDGRRGLGFRHRSIVVARDRAEAHELVERFVNGKAYGTAEEALVNFERVMPLYAGVYNTETLTVVDAALSG